MKRKILFLCCLLFTAHMAVAINCSDNEDTDEQGEEVYFYGPQTDPTTFLKGQHRSPAHAPVVFINGYSLKFVTPCDGCTLQILEIGADIPVYSTIIPSGTQTLQLPTNLSGQYELRIIRGNYCFWGIIEL